MDFRLVDAGAAFMAGREKRDERIQQNRLSQLAAQAYGAAPGQQEGFVRQAIGINPEAGYAIGAQSQQATKGREQRVGQLAVLLSKAPEQMRGQLYQQMLPELQRIGLQAPPDYTPEVDQMVGQLAAVYGGGGGQQLSVRSSFVGEDGQMYSIMSDGSVKAQGVGADRKLQAFDVPGVGPQVVDLRNATARTVTAGGAPQQAPQPQGSAFTFTPAAGTEGDPDAQAFQNLPPDQQAVAAQMLQQGQDFSIQGGRVVPSGMRGGQPMPQPNPAGNQPPRSLPSIMDVGGGEPSLQRGGNPAWVRPAGGAAGDSAMQERVALARSMGATDEDVRRMVLGRDAAAGGAKPMPASVLKMREQTVAEAETANTINMSIDKHLNRIQQGKLEFGMVNNLLAQGRNATGQSTEETRNFAEFRADLEKLRNDSLRLNAGVQTDGDAKRAWDELVANINDTELVKQRLETIRRLNERAAMLKQESVERIDAEYGRAGQASQPQQGSDDIDTLIAEFLE